MPARAVLLGKGKRLKSPKSLVITGASTGFGEALALHYAKPGVSLALTGRNAERLKAVASACEALCVTASLAPHEQLAHSALLLRQRRGREDR